MSDRNAEQPMQDGPNTHHFRTYRGTSYSTVRVEDVDGVTHAFHVPHEVAAAIRADLQEELADYRVIAALKQTPVEGGEEISTVVVRSALMDMLKEGRAAKSELDALKAESQRLAAENVRLTKAAMAFYCESRSFRGYVSGVATPVETTAELMRDALNRGLDEFGPHVDSFHAALSPPPEPSEEKNDG